LLPHGWDCRKPALMTPLYVCADKVSTRVCRSAGELRPLLAAQAAWLSLQKRRPIILVHLRAWPLCS
jgi:hypothetical protein